jgi:hypothetical protein
MSKKSESKPSAKGLESIARMLVNQPKRNEAIKRSVDRMGVSEHQSEAIFWRQRIRSLEVEIKNETAKRIAAENALEHQTEKLRQLEIRISIMEGEKSIDRSGRLKDDEIKRTKIYRSLESLLIKLQADNSCLQDLFEKNKRFNEMGKIEIQRQVEQILRDALLPKARREYYERLIQEIDTTSLKVLLSNMNFSDDQNH